MEKYDLIVDKTIKSYYNKCKIRKGVKNRWH